MINDIDINKIVVSNKLSFHKQDFKCFIRYRDSKKMRPLCIFRPKMSIYKRDFDKTRCMYYSIKDEILLKNIMKFEKKLVISTKKNLTVNLNLIKNISMLNKKSAQKIAFNIFVHE